MTKMEQVLAALFSAVSAGMPQGVKVLRNETLPSRIPPDGLVIIRDGNPGEPVDVLMSPPLYFYDHRVEVDLIVDQPPARRDGTFDSLKESLGQLLAADRTLGGVCDYAEGESPSPQTISLDGAEGWKAATVVVVVSYGSSDPLL